MLLSYMSVTCFFPKDFFLHTASKRLGRQEATESFAFPNKIKMKLKMKEMTYIFQTLILHQIASNRITLSLEGPFEHFHNLSPNKDFIFWLEISLSAAHFVVAFPQFVKQQGVHFLSGDNPLNCSQCA